MDRPPNAYLLADTGHPVKDSPGPCVQIGTLQPADRNGACYALAQLDLKHHVEPLPLDEFGYLYPPLAPEYRSKSANIARTRNSKVPVTPAVPEIQARKPARSLIPNAVTPVRPAPANYMTKVVRFSTPMPFQLNRAHLSHRNRLALTAFVDSLEDGGVERIRITGHTDTSGPARFNRWLSVMRARSAQLWLLSLGVDPRTITVRGVGSSEPRPHASNAADDRYVDLKVIARIPSD